MAYRNNHRKSTRSTVRGTVEALRRSSWTWLLVSGAIVQGLAGLLPTSTSPLDTALLLVGGLMIVFGGANVGIEFGKQRADEALREAARPPFRRTVDMLRFLYGLANDIQVRLTALDPKATSIAVRAHATALEVLAGKLDTQLQATESAVEEWEAVLPDETERLKRSSEGPELSEVEA